MTAFNAKPLAKTLAKTAPGKFHWKQNGKMLRVLNILLPTFSCLYPSVRVVEDCHGGRVNQCMSEVDPLNSISRDNERTITRLRDDMNWLPAG